MSRLLRNRITGELFRQSTLGDQVRAEARRAEAWYGTRPCKGEDLRIIFDAVFDVK
jgi:hypothetical protein